MRDFSTDRNMQDNHELTFHRSLHERDFWQNRKSDQNAVPYRIKKIKFGITSAEDVVSTAVTTVEQTTLYDRALPRSGSLNDARLGVSERNLKCGTCTNSSLECDGHTGQIVLAEPVYHAGFISYIVRILRCVCFFCGELSVPEDSPRIKQLREKAHGNARKYFEEVTNLLKGKKNCIKEDCRAPYPKWIQQGLYIRRDWDETAMAKLSAEEKVVLNPVTVTDVLMLLQQIPDRVYKALGVDVNNAHPADAIITHMIVPSMNIRPSIMFSDSSKTRGQDSLTHKLQEVLKASQKLSNIKEALEKDPNNKTLNLSAQVVRDDLQYFVATYYSNDVPAKSTPPPLAKITGNFVSRQRRSKKRKAVEDPAQGEKDDKASKQRKVLALLGSVDENHGSSAQACAAPGTTNMLNSFYVPAAHVTTSQRRRTCTAAHEKSVMARLKGKKGQIRGNNMGKRVNFSGRTIITPDSTIEVDEVGVPEDMAKRLTYPEHVTPFNIDKLSERVRKGPNRLDGACSILRNNGQRVPLEFHKSRSDIQLEIGDRVERPMQNGDYVLFNRQPTLHKKSMMGHRVRIMKDLTMRLNNAMTTPYNADFDGDEMNMHVPQSIEPMAEIMILSSVEAQIMNAQNSRPCIGLVQDALLGIYLLSRRNTFITKEQFMQAMCVSRHTRDWELPVPAVLKPAPLWTGKQLISMFIPDISMEKDGVVIINGDVVDGEITKSTAGPEACGGILHVICKSLGNRTGIKYLSDAQRVISSWLDEEGFSMGLSDCQGDRTQMMKKLNAAISIIEKTERLGQQAGMDFGVLESKVSQMLGKLLDVTGADMMTQMRPNNALDAMVKSGSKGSRVNIAQIIACVGQQSIGGHRIFDEHNPSSRSLVQFPPGCTNVRSRGFNTSSYMEGLSPEETFFHSMAGIEGLVGVSISTSDVGYIARRIAKSMENYCVAYDGSVRDSYGNILEFIYGTDGFDGALVEKAQTKWMLHAVHRSDFMLEEEYVHFMKVRRVCIETSRSFFSMRVGSHAVVPRNIKCALMQLRGKEKATGPYLNAREAHEMVKAFLHKIGWVNAEAQTCFLEGHARWELRTSVLLENMYVRSKQKLQAFLSKLEDSVQRAKVEPGEMVGSLSAQSASKPATQMTLSQFHSCGIAEKNAASGVPRLRELIDNRKDISTPLIFLPMLDQETSPDADLRRRMFAERMCEKFLTDIVESADVVYWPDPYKVPVCGSFVASASEEFSARALEPFRHVHDHEYTSYLEHIIRLEITAAQVQFIGMSVWDVAECIRKTLGPRKELYWVTGCEDEDNWVVHVRICGVGDMVSKCVQRLQKEHPAWSSERLKLSQRDFEKNITHSLCKYLLKSVRICGIDGISLATVEKQTISEYNKETCQVDEVERYYVHAVGSNLRSAMCTPGIDWQHAHCNNVQEVYELLGIEAAAHLLYEEFTTVLTENSKYIDPRHLLLIVHVMTRLGCIMPLSRFGLNKLNTTTLQRISFEQITDILTESCFFGADDKVNAVSDSIMCGLKIPGGTGMVSLIIEPEYLKRHQCEKQKKQRKLDTRVLKTFFTDQNFISKSVKHALPAKWTIHDYAKPLSAEKFFDGSLTLRVDAAFTSYTENDLMYPENSPFCAAPPAASVEVKKDSSFIPLDQIQTSVAGHEDFVSPTSPKWVPESPVYEPGSPSFDDSLDLGVHNPALSEIRPSSPVEQMRPSSPFF